MHSLSKLVRDAEGSYLVRQAGTKFLSQLWPERCCSRHRVGLREPTHFPNQFYIR